MLKRICAAILLAAVLLPLAACGLPVQDAAPIPEQERIMATPEPTLGCDPAPLYSGVETDQRVVSLIFEGYSDVSSMQALTELLRERGVEAVFFISGVTASEQPELLRTIQASGLEIGNYGITGRKDMQDASASDNIHQFTRAQELIYEACGAVPTLFRCNGTEYTREMLQAAAASGLTAGVEPTAYLNHRSFSGSDSAATFVRRLQRGSVISVKLGQELDAAEYGEVVSINEETPAIDPMPGISDTVYDIARSTYQTIAPGVEWLLDALDEQGYSIVSLEELQLAKIDMFGKAVELEAETEKLLDISQYKLPVTDMPMDTGSLPASDGNSLEGTVLVGDSVMEGIRGYVEWRRGEELAAAVAANDGEELSEEQLAELPRYLDGVSFLTSVNLTVESLLQRVDGDSEHPTYDGQKMALEDAVYAMGAKRVYLMLSCDDPMVYTGGRDLGNVKLLAYLIIKNNPGVELCLVSYPPNRADADASMTNEKIFRYDLELSRMCRQYGLTYIDAAYALRDSDGKLKAEYCLDPNTYATHLSDAGCQRFLDYLTGDISGD